MLDAGLAESKMTSESTLLLFTPDKRSCTEISRRKFLSRTYQAID